MRALAVAAGLLVALSLGSCGLQASAICVDYIGPLSPADAGSEAALVVVGSVAASTSGRMVYGQFTPVHRVAVQEVLKGELPADVGEIDVAAVPQTCNGEAGAFPDGDPLDVDGRVELFLYVDEGEYRLLTPWDGVIAAPEGEPLAWMPLEP